jgi:hypothetical protein
LICTTVAEVTDESAAPTSTVGKAAGNKGPGGRYKMMDGAGPEATRG